MSDYKYKSVYPNDNPEIDESQFKEDGAVRLENMCCHCGCTTLYARKSSIGYWIACASKGCEGAFNELIKAADKRRYEYYQERGIELYKPTKEKGDTSQ